MLNETRGPALPLPQTSKRWWKGLLERGLLVSEPGGGPEGDQIYLHTLYRTLYFIHPSPLFWSTCVFLSEWLGRFLFVFNANNGNDTCFKIGISSQLAALVAHFSLLHTHTLWLSCIIRHIMTVSSWTLSRTHSKKNDFYTKGHSYLLTVFTYVSMIKRLVK